MVRSGVEVGADRCCERRRTEVNETKPETIHGPSLSVRYRGPARLELSAWEFDPT